MNIEYGLQKEEDDFGSEVEFPPMMPTTHRIRWEGTPMTDTASQANSIQEEEV